MIETIEKMSPRDLITYLEENFYFEIPEHCETVEELQEVNNLAPKISNSYAYLQVLSGALKIMGREYKRKGQKFNYEDVIDKKTLVDNYVALLNQQYKALSRMVTVKQMINDEMKMI